MKRFFLALLTVGLCTAPAVHAQVYKWIDKDGKVQYSDQPPAPGAAKSAPQKLIGSAPADSAAPAAKPLKEQVKDSDKKRAEATEKQNKDEENAKRATQNQARCDEARGYLRTLQAGGRISKTDANGERNFLEDNQLQSEISKTQQVISESCK